MFSDDLYRQRNRTTSGDTNNLYLILIKIISVYVKLGHFLNLPQEGFDSEMNKVLFIRPQVFFSKLFEQTDGI